MENRMKISDNKLFTCSSQHCFLQVVLAAYFRLKKHFCFPYINYSFYFKKCQVKNLFFLNKFLKIKRWSV